MSTPTIGRIVSLIEAGRFNLTHEKQTQIQIESALAAAGICFERECRLSDEDIPDFFVEGGIVVEVKIKGQRRAIFRQIERYAAHEPVRSVILVTAVAMQLPAFIDGKPARVASLGKGWL